VSLNWNGRNDKPVDHKLAGIAGTVLVLCIYGLATMFLTVIVFGMIGGLLR
jgi:hypothetical protein